MATVRIGTSGWHYAHWRQVFYPGTLPPRHWLAYYAAQFPCVEINNTFYRRPSPTAVREWHEQSPDGFRFAVKAWRVITHRRKLLDCEPALASFFTCIEELREKAGPILFQLPPRWRRNPKRLDAFLHLLPPGRRYAFEFRDPDWHHPEVYAVLSRHNAAFCVYDLAGWHTPLASTADFVYLRLHAPEPHHHGDYPAHELRAWAERVQTWAQAGKDVYAFFNNDQGGYAVANAAALQRCLLREDGASGTQRLHP